MTGRAGKRPPASGRRQLKVRAEDRRSARPPRSAGSSGSSTIPTWPPRKREGYRSRAAYKLIEIDDKQRLLKPGRRVVDLGAAPGGWTQVAAERVQAVGAARARWSPSTSWPMEPIAGVEFVQLDFMDDSGAGTAEEHAARRRADVVLSDMAAQGTGHTRTDHLRIMGLAEAAVEFACEVLAPGGAFVCKVFQGGTERELLDRLKRAFTTVKHVKPPASRAESAELYVIATGFKGDGGRATP